MRSRRPGEGVGGEGRGEGEVKCAWPTPAHPGAPRTVLGRSSLVL